MSSATSPVWCFFVASLAILANTRADESTLETEVQLLKEAIERLESKMPATVPIWDCYKTQDVTENDIIEFDYCSVDTMTSNPSTGLVAIDNPGTYRLTFMGRYRTSGMDQKDGAYVRLKVNNDIIASSGMDDAYNKNQLSINVLHHLQVGDVVTIEFEGYGGGYLNATSEYGEKFIHWTGQKIFYT